MSDTAITGRSELHVGWLMPMFFHPLPVDVTDHDEIAERLVRLATTVLADRSADEQHFFAQLMLRQTGQLVEAKAEYAGMCFVEHEGEPTMATVLSNRVPSLGATVEEAAEATAALLRRRYVHDEVYTHALPLDGTPAVTRAGGLEVSIPAGLSEDGQPQVLAQGVVQTYVPLPGRGETLVLELSTPSRRAWGMYREMFTAIVETLDWATDEQLAQERELERIAGLPGSSGVATQVSSSQPESEPVDQEVAQSLRRYSSLVLDIVGMRGPFREDADEFARTVCTSCRPLGLSVGCTVRHHWEMSQLAPETLQSMLAAARDRLVATGLAEDGGASSESSAEFAGPGDSASAQGYTISLLSDADRGLLLVDVATVCTRGTSTTLADDFG